MPESKPPTTKRTRAAKRPKQTLFKLRQGVDQSVEAMAAYETARARRYRDVFDTLIGREVLADILMTNGVFSGEEPQKADVANFRNGARWAACEILRAMGAEDADALTRAVLNDDVSEVFE